MRRSGGLTAMLSGVLALSAAFAGSAQADSIEVSAAEGADGPSSVVMTTGYTLAAASFVGSVLTEGRLTSCAADYAAGRAAPRSATVTAGVTELAQGAAGASDGATAVLPEGTWSLCGWVQPGGEGAGVAPSAAAGPVVFTVGGPQGSTTLQAPTVIGQDQPLSIPVAYQLLQAAGQFPGSAQASLQLAAATGDACPGTGGGDVPLSADGPLVRSSAVTSPGSSTVSFSGRLAPGTYSLCTWLSQTFPQTSYPILPGLLAEDFGSSQQSLVVLATPGVSQCAARWLAACSIAVDG